MSKRKQEEISNSYEKEFEEVNFEAPHSERGLCNSIAQEMETQYYLNYPAIKRATMEDEAQKKINQQKEEADRINEEIKLQRLITATTNGTAEEDPYPIDGNLQTEHQPPTRPNAEDDQIFGSSSSAFIPFSAPPTNSREKEEELEECSMLHNKALHLTTTASIDTPKTKEISNSAYFAVTDKTTTLDEDLSPRCVAYDNTTPTGAVGETPDYFED